MSTRSLTMERHYCHGRRSQGLVQPGEGGRIQAMCPQNNRPLRDSDARGRRTSRSSNLHCRSRPSPCFLRTSWQQDRRMPPLVIPHVRNGTKSRGERTLAEEGCVFYSSYPFSPVATSLSCTNINAFMGESSWFGRPGMG